MLYMYHIPSSIHLPMDIQVVWYFFLIAHDIKVYLQSNITSTRFGGKEYKYPPICHKLGQIPVESYYILINAS